MAATEIWYQHSDDDEGAPTTVQAAEELDTFVDRVLAETVTYRVPTAIQVAVATDWKRGVLEVDLGRETGFIIRHADDDGSTKGDGNPDEVVEYVYMRNLSKMPANVEVPIQEVRGGLREFMETGRGRPPMVE